MVKLSNIMKLPNKTKLSNKIKRLNKIKLPKKIAACAFGMIAAMFLVSCGGGQQGDQRVAAEVDGEKIAEESVTKRIEFFREARDLQDIEVWGQWLVDNNLTPEQIRNQNINSLVDYKVIAKAADEQGFSGSEEEIKETYNKAKESFSEEEWQNNLAQTGLTEEETYEGFKVSILKSKMQEKFTSEVVLSDEEVLQAAIPTIFIYDQARRSSCIQFAQEDEETANDVLAHINDGTLSFEDAVAQYSLDEESKERGGDKGWNTANTLSLEYGAALGNLEKDQVSEVIFLDEGFYIIKCTDIYMAPQEELTTLDGIPAEFIEEIRAQATREAGRAQFDEWYGQFKSERNITINEMPQDVPYAVDLSQFEPKG